jgi:phenylalanyl-tRNA synthetase beta chain
MKVLLSWLREFAPIDADPERVGDELSDLGLAVESMDRIGEGLDGIVVARVLELKAHPNADKVQLVDVDRGDGEALQIVCGAFNMAVGDLVPLATTGTVMPNGMKIERRKLRGELSNGMLCSAKELGFGDDHAGIMILAPELRPGTDLRTALGIDADVLYDLEVNPNRPDAMSVAGVARDLAARLRVPFALPDFDAAEAGGDVSSLVSVDIVDPDLCGRFLARVLRDVRIGASPPWLANRLLALGMRPINRIVDVSNYVMLELGQPNHTYDLAKVRDGALRVRWARDGERIVTLDGVERELQSRDGVIADLDDVPIGIAGVMGGASTEIDATTTDVLLEMAWWHPMAIARSSKALGLRSEASMRFERGTDPQIVELAARRFAQLVLADGGELVAGAIDAAGSLPAPPKVRLRTARVNALLGTALTTAEIASQVEPIGFVCEPTEYPDVQDVQVPSFRPDTTNETDVIEEVARHYGYSNIPRALPAAVTAGALTPRQQERRLLRQVLVGLGIDEALPMPFLAPGDIEIAASPANAVTITNPLAAEESVLRTSLRPGLLKTIAYNESHRSPGVRLFEIAKVFLATDDPKELPHEPEFVAVALAGVEAPEAVDVWRVVAEALALRGWRLEQNGVAGLHPTRSAEIVIGDSATGNSVIGAVGEIDPGVLADFGVDERVAWLELELDAVLDQPHGERPYRLVSRFPSSDIDLAFEVDDATPAAEVERVIRTAGGDLLARLSLFDVFRGAAVTEGRRSLAYQLRLQAPDRTLTDDDIASVRQRVIDAVESQLSARLRS